ncbi:hypothetical protein BOSEA31B_14597 [Hyphomicrobiales bacterium]|nr:hypothetical protein BOSEA31B_14597 [Hyphomicrobiales bacterium]CAH1701091.1 hypothetical protein BOSEA1005_20790 [Hyphomicrobiales bacterium]
MAADPGSHPPRPAARRPRENTRRPLRIHPRHRRRACGAALFRYRPPSPRACCPIPCGRTAKQPAAAQLIGFADICLPNASFRLTLPGHARCHLAFIADLLAKPCSKTEQRAAQIGSKAGTRWASTICARH